MTFLFKKFSVDDEKSSIRVGTDAILLGSWADLTTANNILEIGTGCGVIALMLAQRSNAKITAIDIHRESIEQATENFSLSPWNDRIHPVEISLQEFACKQDLEINMIISNPPFFTNSLKSPDPSKNIAKHDQHLPLDELMGSARQLFSLPGTPSSDRTQKQQSICIIIPYSKAAEVENSACHYGLYLRKQLVIYPILGKPANRIILEFSNQPVTKIETACLTIRNSDYSYSEQYKELTKEFYLNF